MASRMCTYSGNTALVPTKANPAPALLWISEQLSQNVGCGGGEKKYKRTKRRTGQGAPDMRPHFSSATSDAGSDLSVNTWNHRSDTSDASDVRYVGHAPAAQSVMSEVSEDTQFAFPGGRGALRVLPRFWREAGASARGYFGHNVSAGYTSSDASSRDMRSEASTTLADTKAAEAALIAMDKLGQRMRGDAGTALPAHLLPPESHPLAEEVESRMIDLKSRVLALERSAIGHAAKARPGVAATTAETRRWMAAVYEVQRMQARANAARSLVQWLEERAGAGGSRLSRNGLPPVLVWLETVDAELLSIESEHAASLRDIRTHEAAAAAAAAAAAVVATRVADARAAAKERVEARLHQLRERVERVELGASDARAAVEGRLGRRRSKRQSKAAMHPHFHDLHCHTQLLHNSYISPSLLPQTHTSPSTCITSPPLTYFHSRVSLAPCHVFGAVCYTHTIPRRYHILGKRLQLPSPTRIQHTTHSICVAYTANQRQAAHIYYIYIWSSHIHMPFALSLQALEEIAAEDQLRLEAMANLIQWVSSNHEAAFVAGIHEKLFAEAEMSISRLEIEHDAARSRTLRLVPDQPAHPGRIRRIFSFSRLAQRHHRPSTEPAIVAMPAPAELPTLPDASSTPPAPSASSEAQLDPEAAAEAAAKAVEAAAKQECSPQEHEAGTSALEGGLEGRLLGGVPSTEAPPAPHAATLVVARDAQPAEEAARGAVKAAVEAADAEAADAADAADAVGAVERRELGAAVASLEAAPLDNPQAQLWRDLGWNRKGRLDEIVRNLSSPAFLSDDLPVDGMADAEAEQARAQVTPKSV